MTTTTASQWTEMGHRHRKEQDFAQALQCYNEALQLDSHYSEAQTARDMLMNIMTYGNRELYNV